MMLKEGIVGHLCLRHDNAIAWNLSHKCFWEGRRFYPCCPEWIKIEASRLREGSMLHLIGWRSASALR